MTRDEIGKMRETSPRDFDAAVAEKVMGWGWTVGNKVRALRPPEWFGGEDGWPRAKGDEPLCVRWFNLLVAYHADPAADYSVLKLVRETWTSERQAAWLVAIYNIQEKRLSTSLAMGRVFGPPYLYEPGDYAHAALLCVTADAEGGT